MKFATLVHINKYMYNRMHLKMHQNFSVTEYSIKLWSSPRSISGKLINNGSICNWGHFIWFAFAFVYTLRVPPTGMCVHNYNKSNLNFTSNNLQ